MANCHSVQPSFAELQFLLDEDGGVLSEPVREGNFALRPGRVFAKGISGFTFSHLTVHHRHKKDIKKGYNRATVLKGCQ